ncbi:hypothetical protein [Tritonibacter horizontis]|uniref:Uncharacterized protein n=1 Tax=Tritonibacter horizontis TaxID=1768241 RepID=A0A132BZ56_9RHOB|nr:hypothetical protein [Tritonibacter horizontis]KUP93526.1 hypothetical protein TRIHO_15490 [Tritonibacter horizontis]
MKNQNPYVSPQLKCVGRVEDVTQFGHGKGKGKHGWGHSKGKGWGHDKAKGKGHDRDAFDAFS